MGETPSLGCRLTLVGVHWLLLLVAVLYLLVLVAALVGSLLVVVQYLLVLLLIWPSIVDILVRSTHLIRKIYNYKFNNRAHNFKIRIIPSLLTS